MSLTGGVSWNVLFPVLYAQTPSREVNGVTQLVVQTDDVSFFVNNVFTFLSYGVYCKHVRMDISLTVIALNHCTHQVSGIFYSFYKHFCSLSFLTKRRDFKELRLRFSCDF